jgi:DNA-binding response OmpR family regulator
LSRILVIEDNEDLAFGLRSNLEIEGHDVLTAATGTAGVQQAREFQPDLILLDLMLPEMDGFDVLKALRKSGNPAAILILTARGEEMDKVTGLRLGADDYVTKPFGLMELLARVEALLRRTSDHGTDGTARAGETRQVGPVEICPGSRSVYRDGKVVDLAPKEFDLLLELVRRDGAVVSRMELMKKVWGHSSAVVSRTVDTHIAELRRKLEKNSAKPELIITVRKAGYRIGNDRQSAGVNSVSAYDK